MTQDVFEQNYPRLAAAVASYNRSKEPGLGAAGSGDGYRKIVPPGWPSALHYEFLAADDESGGVGVELHAEKVDLAGLADTLKAAVTRLAPTFPGIEFDPEWLEKHFRIVIRTTGATPEVVAETMKGLIAETKPQVDAWLRDRKAKTALNTILYGPPGTGKTYHTVNKALEIIDPVHLAAHLNDRAALKRRFDELVAAERIEFVTVHQSFSYEDFIEGLRADNDEASGELRYRFEDGVFKRLCDRASTSANVTGASFHSSEKSRIWKISIDGTGPSKTRDYCLSHGEARIGWGDVGDLSKCDFDALNLGSNDKSVLRNFSVDVQPGDILLCIRSVTEVLAVGVVTAEYAYDSHPPTGIRDDFRQLLKVNWLRTDLSFSILSLNGNTRFTLKTVYELARFTWADLVQALETAGIPLQVGPTTGAAPPPYVLIIDEINRGNISRIFGELITLIEVSKRRGAAEALTLKLPCSKKPFSVPNNVYLIGTMNTADRSLAALDNALRRRFTFEEMAPNPALLDGVNVSGVPIGQMLRVMNQRIEILFDRDHRLGHAYLLPLVQDPTLGKLARIFQREILPLLQEYFFEDWQRIAQVLNDHRKPAAHQFVRKLKGDTVELLGADAESIADRRWEINLPAFALMESYLGIIKVPGGNSESADPAIPSAVL